VGGIQTNTLYGDILIHTNVCTYIYIYMYIHTYTYMGAGISRLVCGWVGRGSLVSWGELREVAGLGVGEVKQNQNKTKKNAKRQV